MPVANDGRAIDSKPKLLKSTPGRTRTCYLHFRKVSLYPDELRGRDEHLPRAIRRSIPSVAFLRSRDSGRLASIRFHTHDFHDQLDLNDQDVQGH